MPLTGARGATPMVGAFFPLVMMSMVAAGKLGKKNLKRRRRVARRPRSQTQPEPEAPPQPDAAVSQTRPARFSNAIHVAEQDDAWESAEVLTAFGRCSNFTLSDFVPFAAFDFGLALRRVLILKLILLLF